MGDTPGRTLELLSLLQARTVWVGSELAERLGVTDRTLRRDIERLRLLGYPVEANPGRFGGYRLGRGGSLPPLLLSDEEAVAVAIGLRLAVDGTVAGLEESAVAALAKLDKMLPSRLGRRVRAVHEGTASLLRQPREEERINAAQLILLAHACSARERLRFSYTDKGGRPSSRLVEPLGVVRAGSRWYLAARDIDRADWRTFRLDRIRAADNVGTRFELTDPPDPVRLVTDGLSALPYPFTARIRLPLPLDEAVRLVPRTVATLADEGDGTIVEVGSGSMERMVAYLAGLSPPCQVLDPPELRAALCEHVRAVAAANRA